MATSERLKIGDLKVGDRVCVTWHKGQQPVCGTVTFVVRHASRASGTRMQTDAGNRMRLNARMTILREAVS